MISSTDRYFIERKYHNPEKEFDAFKRMAYHGTGYIEESGLDDEQILDGLAQLEKETEHLPHPIARAMAIKYVLENERIYINEHDYFVGLYSLGRLANKTTFEKWAKDSQSLRDADTLECSRDFNNSGAVMIWTDYDHVVPDWKSLMELGFSGIRERSREYRKLHEKNGTMNEEKSAFFEGIEIEYSAIIDLIDRMYNIAKEQTFDKSSKIATCLKNLRDGKPTDFYEALQLIYIYFIVSESVDSYQVRSLGNGLDGTLLPFYENDIASGKYTKDDIRDFLSYFLMQWSAIGNYWGQPFYMGGTNLDGSTKYNELSYEILDVYDILEIYNPKIQLKINTNTPDFILNKAFDMVRRKNASFVFCCEPAMIKAVMGYGATYEEALNMDIRGCYETGVRANEVSSTSGYVNAAKAVELVFYNGFDNISKKQIGIKTGEISEIKTFEDFYFAFLKQWEYLIQQSMKITNDAERFLAFVNPSSMYSATIETSLKNGRDGYGGGVKFNNNAMLNCGFASAVDSLMAVKEFVFDKKEISLTEMAEVLKNNWKGYEILQIKAKKSPHKYGNNDTITDTYASAMASYFANKVNNVPNNKGGVYKAIFHSARAFVIQGERTGALPDGRNAGEELSKNASAAPGMDKNGVTALIESATKLVPSDYHESFCLDVMLHPSAIDGENGFNVFKGILMTYLKKDGQSIQFNVFNTDTLRDAQENPEKYQNLQVRVCGWNTLWNNMSKKEQDAYILRSENIQ
ncbi:MAG: hypothetical protein E7565_00370 [Ruminococcaceae bacterium]|nr:hypothetical protein [Oscillospiraceae bacterium]